MPDGEPGGHDARVEHRPPDEARNVFRGATRVYLARAASLRPCRSRSSREWSREGYLPTVGRRHASCPVDPVACGDLIAHPCLPDFRIELVRDWVFGAYAKAGRSRASLSAVHECLYRFAGTPVGQSKPTREAGLANNTVAARHPLHPRTPADFDGMSPQRRGETVEWAVAQEPVRRAAIRGNEFPELIPHWSSEEPELDFVESPGSFIEAKHGRSHPFEFAWFPQVIQNARLTVVCENRFETERIRAVTLADFLAEW